MTRKSSEGSRSECEHTSDIVESLQRSHFHERKVYIRNEPHAVLHALLRGLSHATYRTGQILFLTRLANPDGEWLTIPPGMCKEPRLGCLVMGKGGNDRTTP